LTDAREQDAFRAVLKALYDAYHGQPRGSAYEVDLVPLTGVDDKLSAYVVERYDGQYWDQDGKLSSGLHAKIRPEGVKLLRQMGEKTFLDDDLRFRILVELRNMSKTHGPYASVDGEGLANALHRPLEDVMRNLVFLNAEGLIKLDQYVGPNVDVKIRKRGIEVADAFERSGGEPADAETPLGAYQHIVGPNERAKAELMFRDQVELARNEVVIVDAYAKPAVFDWLKHVPKGVNVRVLTTTKIVDTTYVVRVQAEKAKHSLEVKHLPAKAFGLHGRFVIRDGARGWSWDASLADAGIKRHTVTELEPVNTQIHYTEFQKQWPNATEVR
jgi:hypothetical protein